MIAAHEITVWCYQNVSCDKAMVVWRQAIAELGWSLTSDKGNELKAHARPFIRRLLSDRPFEESAKVKFESQPGNNCIVTMKLMIPRAGWSREGMLKHFNTHLFKVCGRIHQVLKNMQVGAEWLVFDSKAAQEAAEQAHKNKTKMPNVQQFVRVMLPQEGVILDSEQSERRSSHVWNQRGIEESIEQS